MQAQFLGALHRLCQTQRGLFPFIHIQRRFGRIVTVLHARRPGTQGRIAVESRIDLHSPQPILQHFPGNPPGPQNGGHRGRGIHHRRFHTDPAAAAVQDGRYLPGHILSHIFGVGGTGLAGHIGAGRGDGTACRPDQGRRHRMGRHTDRYRIQPGRHDIRHNGRTGYHNSQRSRPERFHQRPGIGVQPGGQRMDLFRIRNMQDQRIIRRTALGRKNLCYRLRLETVCTQTVDRFRRKGNHLARRNQAGRFRNRPFRILF